MQVSGLASGLDTSSIISQLMSVERLAGQGLTKSKTTSEGLLGALQRLNSLVKTMQTSAEALVPDTLTKTSAWTATMASSSKTELATASSDGKAAAGSVSFTVKSVAAAGSVVSGNAFSGTALLNGGAGFSFDVTEHAGTAGATTTKIDVGANATMADVAAAINGKAGLGLQATMVQVAPDQYKLQIQSKTTGANSDVTVAAGSPLGTYTTMSDGIDTVLHLGPAAPGGFDVTSPTATVKDLMPGVSITAIKADPATPVTVEIKNDVAGLTTKVQAMVDAANEALGNIRINSKYDANTKTAGSLLGESSVRDLQSRISNVFVGSTTLSPAIAGVSLDREGKVTFDKAKFEAAYAKDPAAVEEALTGTAKNLAEVGKQATNPTDGLLSVRIKGEQSLVNDYTKQIARFEDRMSLRKQVLERQFSALESMLSKLQAQGNWLAGQLKSLPTPSSNNSSN